jgi:hypothetical protein
MLDRSHAETADLVLNVFELPQTLRERWVPADHAAKHRMLETVARPAGSTARRSYSSSGSAFGVLADALISKARGAAEPPDQPSELVESTNGRAEEI